MSSFERDSRESLRGGHGPMWFLWSIFLGSCIVSFGAVILYIFLNGGFEETWRTHPWFIIFAPPVSFFKCSAVYVLCFYPLSSKSARDKAQKAGPVFGTLWGACMVVMSPAGALVDFLTLSIVFPFESMSGEISTTLPCPERALHWFRFKRIKDLTILAMDGASDTSVGFNLIFQGGATNLVLGIPIAFMGLVVDGFAIGTGVTIIKPDLPISKRVFLVGKLTEVFCFPLTIIATIQLLSNPEGSDDSLTSSQIDSLIAYILSVLLTGYSARKKWSTWQKNKKQVARGEPNFPIQASTCMLSVEDYDEVLHILKKGGVPIRPNVLKMAQMSKNPGDV